MPTPLFATWLIAAALGAGEDDVLIYRCTDATGHDTYQDAACPENSFQHIIRMQRPSEAPPAPARPAAAPAASAAPASPAPPDPATEAEAAAATSPPAAAESGEAGSTQAKRGFSLPPWETEESLKPPPPPPSGPQVRRVASDEVPPLPALWRCRGLDRKAYISATDKPPPKCIPLAELGIQLDALPKQMQGSCQNVHDACDPLSPFEVCDHLRTRLARVLAEAGDAERLSATLEARCPKP